VFGGRDRDRGSGGDWAVQDIGAAFESGESSGCACSALSSAECRAAMRRANPSSLLRYYVTLPMGSAAGEISCSCGDLSLSPHSSGWDRLQACTQRPGPCMPFRPIAEALFRFGTESWRVCQ
jgi:hypothetical protein